MLGVGLPWSAALFRLSIPLILIAAICVLYLYIKRLEIVRNAIDGIIRQRAVQWMALLALWVVISWLWTSADWGYYRQDVWRYLKLLMVPVLAVLIRVSMPTKGRLLVLFYTVGVIILMLPTALDGLGVVRYFNLDIRWLQNFAYRENSLEYFRNHIVHGFEVSLLAVFVGLYVVMFRRVKILGAILLIWIMVDMFFWVYGKMALLSLIVGLLFVLVKAFRVNVAGESKRHYYFFILLLIFIFCFFAWDGVYGRVKLIFDQGRTFHLEGNYISSTGARLHFWFISWLMFLDSWLIGQGAGGFSQYLENTKDYYFNYGYSHAHNEYISILSQYGLIGFGMFVAIISSLCKLATRHQDKWIGGCVQGVCVIFLLNALSDASLYNLWEGWALVYFSAIALGTYRVD